MKKPTALYTKTGDDGVSGLADGRRLPKDQDIFEVLGTLDELNSWLGMVISPQQNANKIQRDELLHIQDTLLIIGAVVAGSTRVDLSEEEVLWLESLIDFYQEKTRDDWHQVFLLPGGTELAARLDVARTVCRRLERRMVRIDVVSDVKQYINRLSDYLYALRCFVNSKAGYVEKEFRPKYLDVMGK